MKYDAKYLLYGDADHKGLLETCGNTNIKTATLLSLKRSARLALEVLLKLLTLEPNAAKFKNLLEGGKLSIFQSMKLSRHILKFNTMTAFKITREIYKKNPNYSPFDIIGKAQGRSEAARLFIKWDMELERLAREKKRREKKRLVTKWADVRTADLDLDASDDDGEGDDESSSDDEMTDPLGLLSENDIRVQIEASNRERGAMLSRISLSKAQRDGGGEASGGAAFEPESKSIIQACNPEFSPKMFLRRIHSNAAYEELSTGLDNLRKDMKDRMKHKRQIAKAHFDHFVQSKSIVDNIHLHLKKEIVYRGGGLSRVSRLVNAVQNVRRACNVLYRPLLERKRKTDRIRQALAVLQRFKFFFELPGALKAKIKGGDYGGVVRKYALAKSYKLPPGVPMLARVRAAVDAIVSKFRETLLKKIENPRAPLEEAQATIRLLEKLDSPVHPAWHYLTHRTAWIADKMVGWFDAYQRAHARRRSSIRRGLSGAAMGEPLPDTPESPGGVAFEVEQNDAAVAAVVDRSSKFLASAMINFQAFAQTIDPSKEFTWSGGRGDGSALAAHLKTLPEDDEKGSKARDAQAKEPLALAELRKNLCRDRSVGGSTFRNCFVASEAVGYFMVLGLAATREEAISLGRTLLKHKKIRLANGSSREVAFSDSPDLFQVCDEDAPSSLESLSNMRSLMAFTRTGSNMLMGSTVAGITRANSTGTEASVSREAALPKRPATVRELYSHAFGSFASLIRVLVFPASSELRKCIWERKAQAERDGEPDDKGVDAKEGAGATMLPSMPGMVSAITKHTNTIERLKIDAKSLVELRGLADDAVRFYVTETFRSALTRTLGLVAEEDWASSPGQVTTSLPRKFDVLMTEAVESVAVVVPYMRNATWVVELTAAPFLECLRAFADTLHALVFDNREGRSAASEGDTQRRNAVGARSEPHVSIETSEGRAALAEYSRKVLVVLANALYAADTILPGLELRFVKAVPKQFHTRLRAEFVAVRKVYDALCDMARATYVRTRSRVLSQIVTQGIATAGVDWAAPRQITGVRENALELILELVLTLNDLSTIAKADVGPILRTVLLRVADAFVHAVRHVPKFSSGGALQILIEAEYTKRALRPFVSRETSQAFRTVHSLLAAYIGSNEAERREKLRTAAAVLNRTKSQTSVMMACFERRGDAPDNDTFDVDSLARLENRGVRESEAQEHQTHAMLGMDSDSDVPIDRVGTPPYAEDDTLRF